MAHDMKLLDSLGVSLVISVCSSEMAPRLDKYRAKHMIVPIEDEADACLLKYFMPISKLIHTHLNSDSGAKVLVHCMAGSSRSATMVIAYLMFSRKWNLSTAFRHVKERRWITNPNPGFKAQLREWNQELFSFEAEEDAFYVADPRHFANFE